MFYRSRIERKPLKKIIKSIDLRINGNNLFYTKIVVKNAIILSNGDLNIE